MSLRSEPVIGRGDLIDGAFHAVLGGGPTLEPCSPADLDDVIGRFETDPDRASWAVGSAARALPAWRRAPFAHRAACLARYRDALAARRERFAVAISRAIGKPLWESRTEADALVAKVNITLTAGQELVRDREVEPGAFVRHRPVGVCAVLGPFNFPAHLANGHIVPLLAAGNTVVFKPSEKAPAVGELLAECLLEAGFEPGVVNVVQGGVACAERLVRDPRVDGVMFTGSTAAGRAILRASSELPGRMLALEMGGNNPALVLDDANVPYAAREIAFSGFVTAGQRCTAVRRVLVHRAVASELIDRVAHAARHSVVGAPDGAEVFMGPVIQESARDEALALVARHEDAFETVVALSRREVAEVRGYYLGPGVYVAKGALPTDLGATEWFAPLVFIEVCDDEASMVARANDTRFGLAAAVFTRESSRFRRVADELEAGVINWNRGTVGSSSRLPFGGVKESGNHRPAGLYSALYCADPVAELHVSDPGVGATAPGLRLP
jgi:succinylglutamic semialdehyde dehydrogenase